LPKKQTEMQILSPTFWKSYELIDTGNFEKLERFGDYVLIRPEPQALWDKNLPQQEWLKMAHGRFLREKKNQEIGGWEFLKPMPENWFIDYHYKNLKIRLKLSLTSFGHIGVFPEQAENWNFIYQSLHEFSHPKVLNLFSYTGGASLAAKAAKADVTHLDAVKNVVSWANENMQASQLTDIRWVVDDALKFVQREARRQKNYQAIILDPPAYGRGTNGEKWILEENINELIGLCQQILDKEKSFLVLNLYSMGLSALLADTLVKSHFPKGKTEFGEFYLQSKTQQRLPLGIFLRLKIGF